ncbi:hypothetical protein, partial [Pseudomonas aeruginosa]|uniref:hypothetical protein n=1 Tax=Pseudomonas aeruginosa TaxID=287 RepID=UPI0039788196
VNWCSHCGKCVEVPQKIKNETVDTMPPSNFTPGYISKGNEITVSEIICTSVFTAALFILAKTWKAPWWLRQ